MGPGANFEGPLTQIIELDGPGPHLICNQAYLISNNAIFVEGLRIGLGHLGEDGFGGGPTGLLLDRLCVTGPVHADVVRQQ